MKTFFTISFAAISMATALAATAQPTTPPAPAAAPAATTKSFQDWVVRCPTAPQVLPCDAVQLLIEPKSKQRVLSVSVAYELTKAQYVVRVVLPLGVWLPHGVSVVADQTRIDKVVVRRCEQFGCIVEGLLDAKLRAAMRKGGTVKIVVYDQTKKPMDLKFSLAGYADAEDHMAAETRKVKTTSAGTP